MSEKKLTLPLLDPQLLRPALWEAGKKLSLRAQLMYCLRTPRSISSRAIASARTGLMNISSSTK